jgi:hypothetical protein
MVRPKMQSNPKEKKVTLRFDAETLSLIESLKIPAAGTVAAKVRYLTMRGIASVEAERAALKK